MTTDTPVLPRTEALPSRPLRAPRFISARLVALVLVLLTALAVVGWYGYRAWTDPAPPQTNDGRVVAPVVFVQ